jgi:RNA polymerase sigma-70 factor (ECF subfamily)
MLSSNDLAQQAAEQAQLIAAQRDLQHFAPLYERYFPRIYAYCLRRVEHTHEAEDLASQIFTQAMSNLDQYRGGVFAAWLFRIAHNTVLNHKRRQQPLSLDALPELPIDWEDPAEALIKTEAHERLRQLVLRLPSDQQDLLLLKVVGGLTAEEIGAVVGKSAGATRVALHRIIRQLQQMYEEPEGGMRYA